MYISTNIIGKPELSCSQGNSHTIKAGSSFLCECTVTGSPQPVITWSYNDKPVSADNTKIADTYTTLSLPKISPEQAGNYLVVAENSSGKDQITLSVEVIGGLCLFIYIVSG